MNRAVCVPRLELDRSLLCRRSWTAIPGQFGQWWAFRAAEGQQTFAAAMSRTVGRKRRPKLGMVSAREVDAYLRRLEDPKRSTLQALRRTILEIVPEAEQVISYRVPAFRVGGKTIAGFAAFKNHLSYLPFSGSVIEQLPTELRDYATTKSSVHFSIERPLPKALVKKLIEVRLAELARRAR